MNIIARIWLYSYMLLVWSGTVYGYAISHNKDSDLKEITIFVFTDEKKFEKMLKSQGVSEKSLKALSKFIPIAATASGYAATAVGQPEIAAALVPIGAALASAARYSIGPTKWVMEQKYSTAIHKNVKRGNKGKDAQWNWKSIKKDKKIGPEDPLGLFVVFLDPKSKKVLLMRHMRTNAGIGFKALKNEKGERIGEIAPFEREIKKKEDKKEKDPSYVARVYTYLKTIYKKPDKFIRDIKGLFVDIKDKYKSFTKKYPGTKDKLRFLNAQMDSMKQTIKDIDVKKVKEVDLKETMEFFKREIEATKAIAQDPEGKELLEDAKKKFNYLKKAFEDIIIKPQQK